MSLTHFVDLISYGCYAKDVLVKQLFLWILLYSAKAEGILSCQINQAIVTNEI
jgi:hypothetical protein